MDTCWYFSWSCDEVSKEQRSRLCFLLEAADEEAETPTDLDSRVNHSNLQAWYWPSDNWSVGLMSLVYTATTDKSRGLTPPPLSIWKLTTDCDIRCTEARLFIWEDYAIVVKRLWKMSRPSFVTIRPQGRLRRESCLYRFSCQRTGYNKDYTASDDVDNTAWITLCMWWKAFVVQLLCYLRENNVFISASHSDCHMVLFGAVCRPHFADLIRFKKI